MVPTKLQLIILFAAITSAVSQSEEVIDYYINLITTEKARAVTYELPKNSYSYFPNTSETLGGGEYDYVIVGGGSAGSVIASRLSENSNLTILLLEAGGRGNDFSDIPSLMMYLQSSEYNWGYNTTPQTKSCLGMVNHECPYPRGKGLGGSSLINAMMYVRGNKKDYDAWYRQGNPGWSYKEVLPLFKKSENFLPSDNDSYHGKGGLLEVTYTGPNSYYLQSFIDANVELGRNVVDYNGRDQVGVSQTQFTIENGRRDSTEKAFLEIAKNRTNLFVSTLSLATKINIVGNVARGVTFSKNKNIYVAKAHREVIISSGSIGSPQLLMLSGIGSKRDLTKLGIVPVKDLNVGASFLDHPVYWGLQFTTNCSNQEISLRESVRQYLQGYGPLTIGGNAQGVSFMQTHRFGNSMWPDIEHFIVPSRNVSDIIQNVYQYNDETFKALTDENSTNGFTIVVVGIRPRSRGQVKLKNRSPYEFPLIEANYYTDKDNYDLDTMYRGIQFALELTTTNAFRKINATLRHIHLPACKEHRYLSKMFWYCQLKQLTLQLYHPMGTCKMGKNPRKGAVVNNKLQVYGIKNLRVADASVVPVPIAGHTNAVSIMIGEKLSELLDKQ